MVGVRLPDFMMVTFKYLGNMTTPLSMLFIGIVMFGVKFSEIRLTKDLLVLLPVGSSFHPLIVIAVASFFPIPS
jgi:malate permease and related proteins